MNIGVLNMAEQKQSRNHILHGQRHERKHKNRQPTRTRMTQNFVNDIAMAWTSIIGYVFSAYIAVWGGSESFSTALFLMPVMSIIVLQPTIGQSIAVIWPSIYGTFWGALIAYVLIIAVGEHTSSPAIIPAAMFVISIPIAYYLREIPAKKLGVGMFALLAVLKNTSSIQPMFAWHIVEVVVIGCLCGFLALFLPVSLSHSTVTLQRRYALNAVAHSFKLLVRAFKSNSALHSKILTRRAKLTIELCQTCHSLTKERFADCEREKLIAPLVVWFSPRPAHLLYAYERIKMQSAQLDILLVHLTAVEWNMQRTTYNLFHSKFISQLSEPLSFLMKAVDLYLKELEQQSFLQAPFTLQLRKDEVLQAWKKVYTAYFTTRYSFYYSSSVESPFVGPASLDTLMNSPFPERHVIFDTGLSDANFDNHVTRNDAQAAGYDSDEDESRLLSHNINYTLVWKRQRFTWSGDDIMAINFFMFNVDQIIKQLLALDIEPALPTSFLDVYVFYIRCELIKLIQYIAAIFTVSFVRRHMPTDAIRLREAVKLACALLVSSIPAFITTQSIQKAFSFSYWAPVAVAFSAAANNASAYQTYVLRLQGTLSGSIAGLFAAEVFPTAKNTYFRLALLIPWVAACGAMRSATAPANYGWLVAAFSAVIVCIGSDPNIDLQETALARIRENVLGILTSAFFFNLFFPLRARTMLRREALETLKFAESAYIVTLNYYRSFARINNHSLAIDVQENELNVQTMLLTSKLNSDMKEHIAKQHALLPGAVFEPNLPWHPKFPVKYWEQFLYNQRVICMLLQIMDVALLEMSSDSSKFIMPERKSVYEKMTVEGKDLLTAVCASLQLHQNVPKKNLFALHHRLREWQVEFKLWIDNYIETVRQQTIHLIREESIDASGNSADKLDLNQPLSILRNEHVWTLYSLLFGLQGLVEELMALSSSAQTIAQSELVDILNF